jgi:hypothetical protein
MWVFRNGKREPTFAEMEQNSFFWGLFQEALSEFLGFFSASWADGQPE